MSQLGELQELYGEFEARDTVVIAVAQEDKDLKKHGRILKNFRPSPLFDIVADIGRKKTKRYARTTAYLIDKRGVVRQVLPTLIHSRPSWQAMLHELDAMLAAE